MRISDWSSDVCSSDLVIFHTGYNPDITLFMRQARELGLRWKALVGHGAGHSQFDKLESTFGGDADLLFTVDPAPAQLMDRSKLADGMGDLIDAMAAEIGRVPV